MELETAKHKKFECDLFITHPTANEIYIRVKTSIITAASVFSNPEETVQMWCGEKYAANYTRLVDLGPEGDFIRICLAKE